MSRTVVDAATRKANEREYFDENWEKGTRAPAGKFYSITEGSKGFYQRKLSAGIAGKHVLELGCGPAFGAPALVQLGAEVIGIDISPKAVERAQEEALKAGITERLSYAVNDAEATGYADNTFDVVCGTGILHHLNLEPAMTEIVRVMQPNGTAYFYEPLRHNILINLYRALTPKLRSPDEAALTFSNVQTIRRYFGKTKLTFFHMFGLAAVPLRKTPLFKPVLGGLDAIDTGLFTLIPPLGWQAWVVVLELSAPKKEGPSP